MACRCSDIVSCGRDIETISDMIKMLDSMWFIDEISTANMFSVSVNSIQSISPYNMYDTSDIERKLHNQCVIEREKARDKCCMELNSLILKLASMKSEDESYHDDDDD